MANFQINRFIKGKQFRILMLAGGASVLIMGFIIFLLVEGKPKKAILEKHKLNLTGIVNESFTEENAESALTAQQAELELLKTQLGKLTSSIKSMKIQYKKQLHEQAIHFKKQMTALTQLAQAKVAPEDISHDKPPELQPLSNPQLWHGNANAINEPSAYQQIASIQPIVHTVSFRPRRRIKPVNYLNPAHYVPSNTSVRAVILGGADADASVNGQSKNNGVMLFKFLEDGTLPNGQHSRLKGCRVSGNSYGDISSERAFATLYRLSCARPGQPIIDKEVTGWVFFNGKVGIKGQPLMRDNKVMQWAGISGAMSGIASAAQYAQSVQNIGAYGASSVVPSSNIAPFAAYGGASKAADTLSQYYVKRAEQYHPVIQVGSGNVVTIVFKDGFYLEPDEDKQHHALKTPGVASQAIPELQDQNESEPMNFSVPPEVLGRIERASVHSQNYGGLQ